MSDIKDQVALLQQASLDALFEIRQNPNLPPEIQAEAKNLLEEKLKAELIQTLERFEADSIGILNSVYKLAEGVRKLTAASAAGVPPEIKTLLDRASDVQMTLHDSVGMRSAADTPQEATQPTTDEKSEEPSQAPKPIPPATGAPPPIVANPKPINNKDYAALSDEYVRFFLGADYTAKRDVVAGFVDIALKNKDQYNSVGQNLGNIPWWFIAGIHMLEASFNFKTHLHNGDPLMRRTTHVPAGCPESPPAAGAGQPYTWVESAISALKMKGFANQSDWSLARALYRWEAYNGWGYRSRGVPTPYLWSFSSVYSSGKFVADHQFSTTAVSKQCGAAVLLKFLSDTGKVDLHLGFVDEPEKPLQNEFDQDAHKVETNQQPTVDGALPVNGDFNKFVADAVAAGKLPALRHFQPGDFLVKGGANAANGLNTDPPRELWPNVLNVMKVVDEFRERIGHPVVLNSVYRSETYNKSVGGVSGSQHKKFQASDIRVIGFGSPPDWAAVLKTMRASGFFQGGIGVYNTFVHVDTRGWEANW